ncbi:extracellular solute-binding protein [Nocardioides sp. zg-1308]|uniref:Extracellular solute-binding protein n=1 Tax=Nocardioides renjunii TaxID=3095075 RepID=A0ABU5K8W7_9ACTN|nr:MULTISPECIES: extracellular solute-binding protein [unclassified Nocardioides]MDZ5661361.1 extracellular solute-binding protein [Nocardioides sp. S-58]NPD04472.1 extracellular solute-binding protein [Nocardioides sp. zg-1308]
MRLSALTGTFVAACLLAGCAQGTGDSEETSDASFDSSADLSGEVQVMGFGAGDEIATERLELAEEELGEAKVDLVEGDLDIQQFLSSVASGEPPALVYAERSQIGTFASRGAVVPLTDCIEGEGIDTSVFRESALGEVTFDDEVYGIPEFNVVQLTQANADLLEQSGHTVEDVNGSDWDAVLEANKDLMQMQGGDLATIGYDSKLPEFLPLWAKANGADLISEDGRTAQLDDPAVVEALEFAVSVYDAQGGFGEVKALRDSADFFGDGNQFASGSLGAMPMEQWYVSVLNDVSPDAPMAFDTVRDLQGEPLAWASGSAWAIPKGSPNPEAACRMARVMTETDSWMAAAEERVRLREESGGLFTGILTANEEADEAIREMAPTDGDSVWSQAVAAMYEANDHTFAMPANPAGDEFEQAWQDEVNKVLNGQKEPADALADAQEAAQDALDEAWASWDEK